jgi:hypothetical protein
LYLHELAHAINPYFSKAHSLFLTGYAGLRGGHFEHDLAYHKRRARAYLAIHLVKCLVSYGTTDEEFFRALLTEFKLDRKNRNGFIRKQLTTTY